ncbi:MAG: hypothetical protein KAS07_05130 [Candidatus Pacebacteria bacterium]|nr:hypothetical protein [Candidatus Paceibacterota bacterium]
MQQTKTFQKLPEKEFIEKCKKRICENLKKIKKRVCSTEKNLRERKEEDNLGNFINEKTVNLGDSGWGEEHKEALKRIENGTYRTCKCGKKIEQKKQDACPTTKLCISCNNKEKQK